MNHELKGPYKMFFESPAGVYFLAHMDELALSQYKLAEDDPDNSRDYIQRAKGVRLALNHINSVLAMKEAKKQ